MNASNFAAPPCRGFNFVSLGERHRHLTDNAPILVTGAAGKIGAVGRTVTDLLLKRGLPVRAMVRRRTTGRQRCFQLIILISGRGGGTGLESCIHNGCWLLEGGRLRGWLAGGSGIAGVDAWVWLFGTSNFRRGMSCWSLGGDGGRLSIISSSGLPISLAPPRSHDAATPLTGERQRHRYCARLWLRTFRSLLPSLSRTFRRTALGNGAIFFSAT